MSPKKTVLCQKGFSLIELSIVLVVMGLLMTAGVGLMRSTMKTSKMAKEKANIQIIKNSLISYAFSHGRLPPTDCTDPPCGLPFIDLNISSVSKDAWSRPYGYDVTDVLTTTNSNNLCLTLYQLNNLYEWAGKPPNAACGTSDLVCVTNKDDTDDGDIDADGQGYYLAAYVLSGGEDLEFGAKNHRDNHREYEMSSNPYKVTENVKRDDLVGELSFGEMMAKICNDRNTTIEVTVALLGDVNSDGFDDGEVWLSPARGCVAGTGLTGKVTMHLGQALFYSNPLNVPPVTGCSNQITFDDIARCNVDSIPPVYDGPLTCTVGSSFDGQVDINTATDTLTQ